MARMTHEPWDCPKCGVRSYVKEYRHHHWVRANPPKFCPSCGADAEKQKDDRKDDEA